MNEIINSIIPKDVKKEYDELGTLIYEYYNDTYKLIYLNGGLDSHYTLKLTDAIKENEEFDVDKVNRDLFNKIQEISSKLSQNPTNLELVGLLNECVAEIKKNEKLKSSYIVAEEKAHNFAYTMEYSKNQNRKKIMEVIPKIYDKLEKIKSSGAAEKIKRVDLSTINFEEHFKYLDSIPELIVSGIKVDDKFKMELKEFMIKYISFVIDAYKEYESFAELILERYSKHKLTEEELNGSIKGGTVHCLLQIQDGIEDEMFQWDRFIKQINDWSKFLGFIARWRSGEFDEEEKWNIDELHRYFDNYAKDIRDHQAPAVSFIVKNDNIVRNVFDLVRSTRELEKTKSVKK